MKALENMQHTSALLPRFAKLNEGKKESLVRFTSQDELAIIDANKLKATIESYCQWRDPMVVACSKASLTLGKLWDSLTDGRSNVRWPLGLST